MKPQLGSEQIQWNLASNVVLKINSILPINNKLLYDVNKCFKFSSNDILLFKYYIQKTAPRFFAVTPKCAKAAGVTFVKPDSVPPA